MRRTSRSSRAPAAGPATRSWRSGVVEHAGGVVEDVADLGAAVGQVGPGRVDVGGDQVQALGRARRGRADPGAEDDRAGRARRGQLYHPVAGDCGRSRRPAASPAPGRSPWPCPRRRPAAPQPRVCTPSLLLLLLGPAVWGQAARLSPVLHHPVAPAVGTPGRDPGRVPGLGPGLCPAVCVPGLCPRFGAGLVRSGPGSVSVWAAVCVPGLGPRRQTRVPARVLRGYDGRAGAREWC